MARGKVNVGGAGVSEQTVAPTLNLVEAGLDFITVLVTNKDTEVAKLAITQSNITLDNANDIELAFNETAEVTISLLEQNTEYNITVQATATDKLISEITTLTESTLDLPKWYGDRGVFLGGYTGVASNVIEYIEIATPGNAVDFGDLTSAKSGGRGGCSNNSRGVNGGGFTTTRTDVIDYITIATPGNAVDFGDLLIVLTSIVGVSNDVRGIFAGGDPDTNVIQYITIATPSNTTDFGNLTTGLYNLGACADLTRAVFFGGTTPTITDMQYITIATLGNAIFFGDLVEIIYGGAAFSDRTRGVFFGGRNNVQARNIIQYVTIQTLSNATDFGDMTYDAYFPSGCADGTRGIIAGGNDDGVEKNIISYVTIQTPGNATDFGDLVIAKFGMSATSGN